MAAWEAHRIISAVGRGSGPTSLLQTASAIAVIFVCAESAPVARPGTRGPTALSVTIQMPHRGPMGIGNKLIAAGLQSPLHGMLDGSFDLVRYQGRRSGERHRHVVSTEDVDCRCC